MLLWTSRLCKAFVQQPEARVHLLGLLIQQIPYIKVSRSQEFSLSERSQSSGWRMCLLEPKQDSDLRFQRHLRRSYITVRDVVHINHDEAIIPLGLSLSAPTVHVYRHFGKCGFTPNNNQLKILVNPQIFIISAVFTTSVWIQELCCGNTAAEGVMMMMIR